MWGDIISGVIGGVHNRNDELSGREQLRKDAERNEYQFETNRADQQYWLRHGMQERVRDAQAAGLHPLFALGGASAIPHSSGGGSVGTVSSDTSFASSIGRGVDAAINRKRNQELHDANVAVLRSEAEKNDAIANSYNASAIRRAADAAKITQDGEEVQKVFTPPADAPKVTTEKGVTPAQKWQDEYGDLAENIEGTIHYVKDKWDSIPDNGKSTASSWKRFLKSIFSLPGAERTYR